MLKNLFRFEFHDYWRNIDKNILICFFILFFLGLFFSFSSTSSLAGERLNKTYYFFFTKHLVFTFLALFIMLVISAIETTLLKILVCLRRKYPKVQKGVPAEKVWEPLG